MGPRPLRIRRAAATLLLLSASLAGCGAKTGLNVPDAPMDGSRGADAGRLDAGSDANVPCVELPFDGGIVDLPLQTQVELGRADVVFAIDTTSSMHEEIDQIRANVRDRIAPEIRLAIPDSEIGVTTFADFPVGSCGVESAGDLPFRLVLPVTADIGAVQAAVGGIALNNGGDDAEAQVEALYQIATGDGIGSYVEPSFGCPMGGFGYPCFRSDALPVVLLFTDAPFHNGPLGSHPYSTACSMVRPTPHTYPTAVAALGRMGIRVMGLYSGQPGGEGLADLREVATDTGALDHGSPLVFEIGTTGSGLSDAVIQAITTLASVVEFDIDTLLVDVDRTDAIDPRSFVRAVRAVRADPPSGVRSIEADAGIFRGVRTGTLVLFQLELRNDAVAPGVGPQHFLLEIVFRGDMRTRLGSTIVDLVIPGADGSGCPGRP